MRAQDSQTVGARQRHGVLLADLLQFFLQRRPLRTDFLETGGDDHKVLYPGLSALLSGREYAPGGNTHHCKIYRSDLRDALVALDAQDFFFFEIDRVDFPRVPHVQQVSENRVSHLLRRGRSAHDCH